MCRADARRRPAPDENVALSISGKLGPAAPAARRHGKWRGIESPRSSRPSCHKTFKPLFDPSASKSRRQKQQAVLAQRFSLLDERLGKSEFVVGSDFSVVDAYLF